MTIQSIAGKKVLITGAGGFIGSHLAEACIAAGADVRAFVHYKSRGAKGWLQNVSVPIEFIAGDITDYHRVHQAMKDCDVVFHLAALIGIPYSYHAPAHYVSVNVSGTLNVLQAARELETPRVIHTSTSEVYGTALSVPISEDHPLQAQSPYAATKISADQLALSYYRSFDLPVTIIRPFNTFGPRQSARAIIPTVLSQLLKGQKEIRVGSLTPTRDMNYVQNTAQGFIAAAKEGTESLGEVINLGSGTEASIAELIEMMKRVTNSDASITSENARKRPEKSEVNRLVADATKAEKLLGWKSEISLEEGLAKTADWISEHLNEYDVDDYTV